MLYWEIPRLHPCSDKTVPLVGMVWRIVAHTPGDNCLYDATPRTLIHRGHYRWRDFQLDPCVRTELPNNARINSNDQHGRLGTWVSSFTTPQMSVERLTHCVKKEETADLPLSKPSWSSLANLVLRYFTAAAAAAKSRQSFPTVCDPTDGSPSGSSVPGLLQARILEWVAIDFSRDTSLLHNK